MTEEKQIEEMARAVCNVSCSCDECSFKRQCSKFDDATKQYHAGYRKQSEGEWISVEERLPDKEGVYLVYTYRGRMKMSKYSGWGVDDEASFDDFFVTHWMPLPEAPKMKGGAE